MKMIFVIVLVNINNTGISNEHGDSTWLSQLGKQHLKKTFTIIPI